MAFIEEIQVGVPTVLVTSTIYALPASLVHVTASSTVEVSVSTSTTSFVVLTNSGTIGAFTSAAFVRGTLTTTTICCKKF